MTPNRPPRSVAKSARRVEGIAGGLLLLAAGWIVATPLELGEVPSWNFLVLGQTVIRWAALVTAVPVGLALGSLAVARPGPLRRRLKRVYRATAIVTVLSLLGFHVTAVLFPSVYRGISIRTFPDMASGFEPDAKLGYRFSQKITRRDTPLTPGREGDIVQAGQSPPEFGADGGEVLMTVVIDDNGFRNDRALARAEIVILGDSYAAEMTVTQRERWAHLLAQRTAANGVYNLGVAGYTPQQELAALEEVGLALKPKLVIWSHFEGNDFWDAKMHEELEARGESALARVSFERPLYYELPVIKLFALGLKQVATPSGQANRSALNPVVCTLGARSFKVALLAQYLRRIAYPRATLEAFEGWQTDREIILRAKQLCDKAGVRFLLVYFPCRPRMLWPHVKAGVDADRLLDHVRAFTDYDGTSAQALWDAIERNRDAQEQMFVDYFTAEGIPPVRVSPALARAMASGEQVFWSYDTHMNPTGSRIVAEVIADAIRARRKPAE